MSDASRARSRGGLMGMTREQQGQTPPSAPPANAASQYLRQIQEREGRTPNEAEQQEAARLLRVQQGLPAEPRSNSKFAAIGASGEPRTSEWGARISQSLVSDENEAKRIEDMLLNPDKYRLTPEEVKSYTDDLRSWHQANLREPTPAELFEYNMIDFSPYTQRQDDAKKDDPTLMLSPFGHDLARYRKREQARVDAEAKARPEGREGRMRAAEARGVDTTTGFGSIGDVARIAIKPNLPKFKAAMVTAIAMDQLAAAGVDLPVGYAPVRINDELGQLEYLRPTEDGKTRWTLVEGEYFRMADLGNLADLEEVGSMVGAVAGYVVGKGMVSGEMAGDIIGRNTGFLLESLLAHDQMTQEDFAEGIGLASQWDRTVAAGVGTAVGRGIGAAGDFAAGRRQGWMGGVARSTTDPNLPAAARARAVDEATEAQKFVSESGNELVLTPGAATQDSVRIQYENMQIKNLPTSSKAQFKENQRANRRALRDTAESIYENTAAPGDLAYNPSRAARRVEDYARESTTRTQAEAALDKAKRLEEVNSYGDVAVVRGAGSERTYYFKGDTLEGELGDAGISYVTSGEGVGLQLMVRGGEYSVIGAEVGSKFRGSGMVLYQEAIKDAADNGMGFASDFDVSEAAQGTWMRLREQGYGVWENPNVKIGKQGQRRSMNDDPVFRITHLPGDVQYVKDTITEKYNRDLFEASLEDEMLMVEGMRANAVNTAEDLADAIGWNNQYQSSNILVDNPSGNSRMNALFKRLERRSENALLGSEASEADKLLAELRRPANDEEGMIEFAGLTQPSLDLGLLLNARDRLSRVAAATGDVEVQATVDAIDGMMANNRWRSAKGGVLGDKKRAGVLDLVNMNREAKELLDRTVHDIEAQSIFKTNSRGEFVNTNRGALDNLTNDARFVTHIKPALDSNLQLKTEVRNFLWDQYKETVLSGDKFNFAAHKRFMQNKSEALRATFPEEDVARMSQNPEHFRSAVNRSKERLDNIQATYRETETAKAIEAEALAKGEAIGNVRIGSNDLLKSLREMSGWKRRRLMNELKTGEPELYTDLIENARRQNMDGIKKAYFGEGKEKTTGNAVERFDLYLKENKDILREVFGQQYVQDLEKLSSANRVESMMSRISTVAQDSQPGWLRILRSFLGPLSKPQRIITAATWNQRRLLAKTAVNATGDPAKLRAIIEASSMGLPFESKAGIQLLSRLGILEAAGISVDDPEVQQKVLKLVEESVNADRAGQAGE